MVAASVMKELRSNNYRVFFIYFLSFLSLEYYWSYLVFYFKKVWYLQMKFHNHHLSTRICKQIFDWLKLLSWYSFLYKKIVFVWQIYLQSEVLSYSNTCLAITPRGMLWGILWWMYWGMQQGNTYRISLNILWGNISCNIY